jgi:uncharacterized protein
MRKVFADTVGLIARWDASDQWHERAKAAFRDLLAQRAVLVTTTYVLLECGNASARYAYRETVVRFKQEAEAKGLVIHSNEADWQFAWDAYSRGDADLAGIVDQVSFQVMRRLKIREAFTNDRHFTAAGFQVLF